MLFGIGFFITWTYILANWKIVSVIDLRNLLLVSGLVFIFAIIEIVWEVKSGFKLVLKIPRFIYRKIKLKKIDKKIKANKKLKDKEIYFYKKWRNINSD